MSRLIIAGLFFCAAENSTTLKNIFERNQNMADMQDIKATIIFVGDVYTNDQGKRRQDATLDAGKGEFDIQLCWGEIAKGLTDNDVGKSMPFQIAKGQSGFYGWPVFSSAPRRPKQPQQKQKKDGPDWEAISEGKIRHGIVTAYIAAGTEPEIPRVLYWQEFIKTGKVPAPVGRDNTSDNQPY
jgi:hypothetical protein